MKIFLAYASEDRGSAEQIYFALSGDGHKVFFDRTSLPAGSDFNARIRRAIGESGLMVFLISEDSVASSAYTLTELSFAEKKWPHPAGRVVPVMARPTPLDRVPNYLKAVTILEPRGDVPAEVADAVRSTLDSRSPLARAGSALTAHWQAVLLLAVALPTLGILLIRGGLIAPTEMSSDILVQQLASVQQQLRTLQATTSATEAEIARMKENASRLEPEARTELNREFVSELSTRVTPSELGLDQEAVDKILFDSSKTPEDKVALLTMVSMKELDARIERQAAYINANQDNPAVSVDVETMKLKRLIDKRSQAFDNLRQIIDKYNSTAKGIIESIGR